MHCYMLYFMMSVSWLQPDLQPLKKINKIALEIIAHMKHTYSILVNQPAKLLTLNLIFVTQTWILLILRLRQSHRFQVFLCFYVICFFLFCNEMSVLHLILMASVIVLQDTGDGGLTISFPSFVFRTGGSLVSFATTEKSKSQHIPLINREQFTRQFTRPPVARQSQRKTHSFGSCRFYPKQHAVSP